VPGGRGGALVALLLVNVMWGSTLPISKLAFAEFSPLALSALRLSLAALPLLGWAALRGQLWPPPAPLRLLLPLGLLAMGGNIALLYLALVQTTVVDASIISAVTPVGTLLLARLFLGERAGTRRWLGAALSLLGVAAVVTLGAVGGVTTDAPNRLLGDLGVLVSSAGWAAYSTASKRLSGGPLGPTLGWLFALGALVLVPLAAWDVATGGRFRPSPTGALTVLYLAWGIYVLGFLVWVSAYRYLDAGQVGGFFNLSIVVSVLFAALLLGEVVRPEQLAGGALVLLGVWLALREPARTPTPLETPARTGRAGRAP